MKKTLIALMALAGVAAADTYTGTELNTWLQGALTQRNGSKYTLTFTLADNFGDGQAANLFQLSTSWAIREQHGKYVGVTTAPTSGSAISGDYESRLASAEDRANWDATTVIDTDTAGDNSTSDYSGWFYEGADGDALKGATFTIYSADGDTRITLETSDQTVTLQRSIFYTPDANFKFGLDNSESFKSASIEFDGGTYSIPEPATATLSLLALAGLAARRRRK